MPLDQKASFLLIIFFLMSSLLVINFLLLSPVTDFLQSKVAEDETAKDTQPAKLPRESNRPYQPCQLCNKDNFDVLFWCSSITMPINVESLDEESYAWLTDLKIAQ